MLQKQKYDKLVQMGTVPIDVVKLFLIGDPKAGKTTLQKALIKVKLTSLYSLNVKEWKIHSLLRVVSFSLFWEWKSICVTLFEWKWYELE